MDEIVNAQRGLYLTDDQAMHLAIHEAKKGAGFVSPNPQVGCVILDNQSRFVSMGHHKMFGGPHAEAIAIEGVNKDDLKGARVFVTLEPCAHQGKTPSCAKMLTTLPIAEVIYGLIDPNPLVSGKGAKILEDAGIRTTLFGRANEELEELSEHFLVNQRSKRPFVSVKVATSLDGQMALQNGESQWITCERSREYSHYLRGIHDATMIGKGTLFTDNPQLSIRHPRFINKSNKVIVLDELGESLTRTDLRVFSLHKPENIFVVVGPLVDPELIKKSRSQAHVLSVKLFNNQPDLLDLNQTLSQLWDLGLRSIFVEGGVAVISSFISQMKADRLYLFQAPVLLGAKSGKAWTSQVSINNMSDRISLKFPRLRKIDSDILITGKLI
jgi:diaminohydroxyphosphoribosylaminopyrimidine deaminase / 5-amino-6-(5-phosphoribosylamino)uracil reductase